MDDMPLPPEVPFPPAPWHLSGELWVGFFRTTRHPALPPGLAPVFAPRWRVLMLVRYTGGTRQYDELLLGAMARRGWRIGLFVEHIWVADAVGLWAGRRLWGLPKQAATFTWQGDTVTVADAAGPLATVRVNRRPAPPLRVGLVLPSLGRLDQQWLHILTRLTTRLGPAGLQVTRLAARVPYALPPRPRLAFAAKRFAMVLPAPTRLPADRGP